MVGWWQEWRWWLVIMRFKARGGLVACREMLERFPSAMWRHWWHLITPPIRRAALDVVKPDLFVLPEKSLALDTARRLLFVVHAAGWLHLMVLRRHCVGVNYGAIMVLMEKIMGNLGRTKRSSLRAMCGVQLKDIKRYMYLMLISGFQLNNKLVVYGKHYASVLSCAEEGRWSCVKERGWSCVEERGWCVLRREDGDVLRREDGHV